MALRRIRHWRESFSPDAEYVWRKATTYNGVGYKQGDEVPAIENEGRLRSLWTSGFIGRKDFDPREKMLPPLAANAPAEAPAALGDYNAMCIRARELGYKGRNMPRAELIAFLEEKAA